MTIFSASPCVHDGLTRVKGSLAKMINSTRHYIKYGIKVQWSFILTKTNINEIDSVLKLASNINVSKVSISRLVPSGRALENWSNLEVTLNQLIDFLMHWNKIKSFYSINTVIARTLSYNPIETKKFFCSAGIYRIFVQANGNTLPCPAFKGLIEYLGKSVKSNTLKEIWHNSNSFHKLRLNMHNPIFCFNCVYINKCNGRCKAQQIKKTGFFRRRDRSNVPKNY
ncbi:MAG: radical SAM domain-containing protein [Candidatus Magnetoglobus multicellularis str. Araruama]|uniref:Radical SAM domain-containing protein n=1 Tax=Candidatus Magnetoglobus multicellularis str. Araruama TaxID=890399 RepID=A0A1V1PBJ1_9BACT|nr:MAG: radical SAM domain-containing protein [Candidatus Magnetoglobus multicellularis str. Araruama]